MHRRGAVDRAAVVAPTTTVNTVFPSQIVEAVGACTRALDGPDNAEAVLARSDAATLSGLRAAGDRLALRNRFHRSAIHEHSRPAEPIARQIFDAIESARLDAIGARWLEGVAKNLLAHPGRDDDGLRWLAFEELSGRDAPSNKRHLVATL